jgi:glucose-6-phosphate 1-epimerase
LQVFRAELLVTIAEQSLQLHFVVANSGNTVFRFSSALHTYFQIGNTQQTRLHGLVGLEYRDTVSG